MSRVLTIAVVAALSACGGSDPTVTRIALEVTEGPHAGRYRVSTVGETCAWDVPVPGALAIRYTDLDSAAAVASLQVIVPPDTGFYLGVVFGGFRGDRPGYEIETRTDKVPLGEGEVVVSRDEDEIALSVVGRTHDGSRLAMRVRCASADTTDVQ